MADGTLKVGTITTSSGSGTITLGQSGETISVPSGATTTLTDGISGDLKFNSGFGSVATAYGCRAWVNFNGTGTVAIRGSGNVSSITDNGTGLYVANLTTALTDTNACATSSGSNSTSGSDNRLVCATVTSTTAVDIRTGNASSGAPVDIVVGNVSVFR